jgi:hypothetical protein
MIRVTIPATPRRCARGCGVALIALGWALVGGCGQRAPAPQPAAPAPPPPAAPPVAAAPAPAAPVAEQPDAADESAERLVGEAPERDPRSETVTIKIITERRQAHVVWGRKDLGVTPLEIVRPRGSGPLDLVLVAPGCLPLHTRALTDRDDTITLHMYGEGEGPSLLGYHEERQEQKQEPKQEAKKTPRRPPSATR